jgi:hypothetical protein
MFEGGDAMLAEREAVAPLHRPGAMRVGSSVTVACEFCLSSALPMSALDERRYVFTASSLRFLYRGVQPGHQISAPSPAPYCTLGGWIPDGPQAAASLAAWAQPAVALIPVFQEELAC